MPMLGGRGKIIDDKIWHWIYNKHCRSVPAGDFIYSNTIPDRVFIIFESTGGGGEGGINWVINWVRGERNFGTRSENNLYTCFYKLSFFLSNALKKKNFS